MSALSEHDDLLIGRIRRGESEAWNDLIHRYEGRLLAFCRRRLSQTATAEDIVQETFVGFLTSLPNFDGNRNLESYLFSICAHKLTDHFRREGRRPTLPLSAGSQAGAGASAIPDDGHGPSTIVRSGERRTYEEQALAAALAAQIRRWQESSNWVKLRCIELLFVRGSPNKEVSEQLRITEQQVANYKSDFLIQLKKTLRTQGLPIEVFPQLSADN
jgi:RNA polymerase sigma-70 factor (ECF subfamily)